MILRGVRKTSSFLAVVFLFTLFLYQDTIGRLLFDFMGWWNIGGDSSLFLGRLVILPFFLLLFSTYKKVRFKDLLCSADAKRNFIFMIALPVVVLKVIPLTLLTLMSVLILHKSVSLGFHLDRLGQIASLSNTVILGPVIEETLFRGVLYDKLRKIIPGLLAVFFSSLVFAFFHYDNTQAFFAFVTGVILVTVYRRTGNLAYPVLLHALLNFSAIIGRMFVI